MFGNNKNIVSSYKHAKLAVLNLKINTITAVITIFLTNSRFLTNSNNNNLCLTCPHAWPGVHRAISVKIKKNPRNCHSIILFTSQIPRMMPTQRDKALNVDQ